MALTFETRTLKPRADYVRSDQLRNGETYFIVDYADSDLLVPEMQAVVFVGRDVELSVSGHLYFQDMHSYRDGLRVDDEYRNDEPVEEFRGFLHKFAEVQPAVMDFENAIDELLRCYLRRRASTRPE